MPRAFATLKDLLAHGFDEVIDVRSPAEFAEDHIPGAISLPVLSNDERARVGTIYKQESAFLARKIGAALVARNAALHLEGPLRDKGGGWRPLVYCWRGGQRSGSFASILSQVGWRADTVEGGYRSFRRLVVETLHEKPLPFRAVLIDGFTGTGKTELLAHLAAESVQTIDLEGLARHRGSLFGGVAQGQPSQKAFETALAVAFAGLSPDRPVVIEAESSTIGNLEIPPSLWAIMVAAPRFVVTASLDQRARYLVERYADLLADHDRLDGVVSTLRQIHSRERISGWQALLQAGEYQRLAGELMSHHYDPRYAKHQARQGAKPLMTITLESLNDSGFVAAARTISHEILHLSFM